ncbi:diguanylate cyclase [Candidatus Woesearchaeota archaeon]|nr:diguanylate cyclase [Candidatus Woesearchaeota archaeon]
MVKMKENKGLEERVDNLEQYKALGSELKQDLDRLKLEDPEEYIRIKQGDTNIVDEQTNLFSKNYFENELLEYIAGRAREENKTFSYIKFDIDEFHEFNDKFGHKAGDKGIQYVVQTLTKNIRTKDIMKGENPRAKDLRGARVGYGEEFAAIFYDVDESQARMIAERIRESIAHNHFKFEGQKYSLTASFGVAEFNPGEDTYQLLKRADEALYAAKRNGKNKVETYPIAA